MSTETDAVSLDSKKIRQLIEELCPEELQLFSALMRDVKERGLEIVDLNINDFAKKYADKARQLAGNGGVS